MTPDLSRLDEFTILLISGIVVAATIAFWPLLGVIVLSISLAVVVIPLQRRFSRYMSEEIAAVATTTLVFLALSAAIFFTITVVYENADYLSEIIGTIIGWIRTFQLSVLDTPLPITSDQVAEWLRGQIVNLSGYITGIIRGIPFLIMQVIIFFLSLYMFIWKGDELRKEIVCHLPVKVSEAIGRMSEMVVNTLYAIYVVHIATSVLTFILAVPFFYFLGYDHVIFYSVMAAIFQLIPIIGPSLLMLFLGIFALSMGDLRGAALIAFIGYPVVCAFPDIYLRPLMMGARASIHPVLMWIGFFGGLAVMGLVGFVLGPLFIALVVSGFHIIVEELGAAREEGEVPVAEECLQE